MSSHISCTEIARSFVHIQERCLHEGLDPLYTFGNTILHMNGNLCEHYGRVEGGGVNISHNGRYPYRWSKFDPTLKQMTK